MNKTCSGNYIPEYFIAAELTGIIGTLNIGKLVAVSECFLNLCTSPPQLQENNSTFDA